MLMLPPNSARGQRSTSALVRPPQQWEARRDAARTICVHPGIALANTHALDFEPTALLHALRRFTDAGIADF